MSYAGIARGIAGVLLGFGVFLAIIRILSAFAGSLTNAASANYLLVGLMWTVAAAVLSGYVAARIAGSHEIPYGAAVGLLIIAMSLIAMRQDGASQPGWYQITVAGCGPVSAMIGAAIRLLTKPRSTRPGQTANSNTSGAASRR